MAVLAELLARGRNVAVPEVDVGEDVFAFQDGQHGLDRLQVKTANATPLQEKGRYAADVSVPPRQLLAPDDPPLVYVFPVRLEERWVDFLILGRAELSLLKDSVGIG